MMPRDVAVRRFLEQLATIGGWTLIDDCLRRDGAHCEECVITAVANAYLGTRFEVDEVDQAWEALGLELEDGVRISHAADKLNTTMHSYAVMRTKLLRICKVED